MEYENILTMQPTWMVQLPIGKWIGKKSNEERERVDEVNKRPIICGFSFGILTLCAETLRELSWNCNNKNSIPDMSRINQRLFDWLWLDDWLYIGEHPSRTYMRRSSVYLEDTICFFHIHHIAGMRIVKNCILISCCKKRTWSLCRRLLRGWA